MRMYGNVRLIGILVLGMLVLASVQVVGAETAQSWHLLDNTYTGTAAVDGTTHHKNLFMNKTGNASGEYTRVSTTKTVWWYAECPAQVNVSFGTGVNWKVYLYHEAASDEKIKADIYSVNQTGGIDQLATSGWVTATSGNTEITVNGLSGKEQLIFQDSRLGLRISWSGTEASFDIYYYNETNNKFSNLTSPPSDPGYPVPELSTLILFSTGLIALAGYVLLTKRRRK